MRKVHLPIIRTLFKADAITLYPFVFFADQNPPPFLVNHERIHIDQIKKHGFFKFYFSYIRQYIKLRLSGLDHWDSYNMISYEQEAYFNMFDLNYQVK